MFSFISASGNARFNQYKLQTYRLAFPFGTLVTLLYVLVITKFGELRFFMGIIQVIILIVLTVIVWWKERFLELVENIFYFAVITNFLLLTQFSINQLAAGNALDENALSDSIKGLVMWLIIFMLSGFLTLKTRQAELLTGYSFLGMLLMGINNIWYLAGAKQLTSVYLFHWVNVVFALMVTVLLLQRMGTLQQRQATTDALTGVMNRHALYSVLEQEMERAARYKRSFSLILFDLDEFKHINDTIGHLEGDRVLQEVSRLVTGVIRKTDHAGRWGGEEFLLILPETDIESARALAERIRILLVETQLGKAERVSASFGVAMYQQVPNIDGLLNCLDNALYVAKNNGRNQVVVCSLGLQDAGLTVESRQ
jgi:diguanylate cyclase (GGDEF)-like protein